MRVQEASLTKNRLIQADGGFSEAKPHRSEYALTDTEEEDGMELIRPALTTMQTLSSVVSQSRPQYSQINASDDDDREA
jgi:hypothetical protein